MAVETPIRISTNVDELQDESEFLGEIVADEITPGTNGPQYHLAVKPLNFAIGGKTGFFHDWYKISKHKRSKLGVLITKMAGVFGTDKVLGQGMLVGQRAWFIRQDIIFGTDKNTGEEMKAEAVLQPCRAMSAGDEALIQAQVDPAAGPAPKIEKIAYTDEQIDQLLSAIDGANASRLAILAARTNLPAELKQAIMSGEALKTLTDMGLATVAADGKITVAGSTIEPESLPAETAAEAAPKGKTKFAGS